MSSGDLNINSIDRFRKQSDRLVLEHHGSCEVPAGCGGVVMRWHNPDSGQPAVFSCAAGGPVDLFVNGQAIASRVLLPWGESTIAVRLHDVESSIPFILATWRDVPAAARRDRDDSEFILADGCTSCDGTWKCSDSESDDNWIQPGFDDSEWAQLGNSNDELPEENRWRFESVIRKGGQPLQLPDGGAELFIRTKLHVTRGEE